MTDDWRPTLGAWLEPGGVRFRVWAPEASMVDVVFEPPRPRSYALERFADGSFGTLAPSAQTGERYRYRVDGGPVLPDPASRSQPEGVHGPSEIVDPARFAWSDAGWKGRTGADLVIYELHVGTFTTTGTFGGAIERLRDLAHLGVTAVELMPIADFPGRRNWGYDGVSLFAPARCYGTPDDLRRLVDAAHGLGLAVFLDVVYNHLGPEGNYLSAFSPYYFSDTHRTAWGAALNIDGPHSSMVRQFFYENALHWLHDYHIDGLRLDATHAIIDHDDRPFVARLTARLRESARRHVHVIAEDHRNLAHMIRSEGEGGWGLDGVWADDFHHQVRVALAGDHEGYYRDYTGSISDLVRTLNQGWYFTGQYSTHLRGRRGTDPAGIPSRRFVFCIQNHDQVGNRALGERLHHDISLAAYRAASVLLLCAPATPLLFMGQEWAASTPFLYFTDHPATLGQSVTEGRRNEFRHFSAFSAADARERIPDPQQEETFLASRLDWSEATREPHASTLRLYHRLLALRRDEPAIRSGRFGAFVLSATALVLRHDASTGHSFLAIVEMGGPSAIDLSGHECLVGLETSMFQLLFTTEDRAFATDPQPSVLTFDNDVPHVTFSRPSAVLLLAHRGHS